MFYQVATWKKTSVTQMVILARITIHHLVESSKSSYEIVKKTILIKLDHINKLFFKIIFVCIIKLDKS
jgi:hypothetical protein